MVRTVCRTNGWQSSLIYFCLRVRKGSRMILEVLCLERGGHRLEASTKATREARPTKLFLLWMDQGP